jgi:hypothetical protein
MSEVHTHRTFRVFSHWTCDRCKLVQTLQADLDWDLVESARTPVRQDFERDHAATMKTVVEDHVATCTGDCSHKELN